MIKKTVLVIILLIVMFMNSCAAPVGVPVPIVEDPTETVLNPTEVLQPSETSVSTEIPLPTSTPTEVVVPTITPTYTPSMVSISIFEDGPPVEWDLDPYFVKEIDEQWEGASIKARIIIDSSLASHVEGIEIPDEHLAEIMATSLWALWYDNRIGTEWQIMDRIESDSEISGYLAKLVNAQTTMEEEYWRQIQINNIWANDLNDGDGYVREPYNFRFMSKKFTSNGAIPIERINIVFTSLSEVNNLEGDSRWPTYGYGLNFYNGDLFLYIGFVPYDMTPNIMIDVFQFRIAAIPHLISRYGGRETNWFPIYADCLLYRTKRWVEIKLR